MVIQLSQVLSPLTLDFRLSTLDLQPLTFDLQPSTFTSDFRPLTFHF